MIATYSLIHSEEPLGPVSGAAALSHPRDIYINERWECPLLVQDREGLLAFDNGWIWYHPSAITWPDFSVPAKGTVFVFTQDSVLP